MRVRESARARVGGAGRERDAVRDRHT
jgi:hypothetical protein